ncbi:MAG: hypothetical protein U9O56_03705 [Campylobacterota bacterium]|nr:hypothetical protein [Campylobacterota bacterium]
MSKRQEIEELVSKYANIRMTFKALKKKYPDYLEGNDNYIGIIGEYWATIFLKQIYKDKLNKFLESKINKSKGESEQLTVGGISYSNSTEWLDFIVEHDDDWHELISVKTIFEDKARTSGYIKYKEFRDKQIPSIIILKLNEALIPIELLYIKDINNNLIDGRKEYRSRWKDKDNPPINFKYYEDGFDDVFIDETYKYEDDKFIPKVKNAND